MTQTDQRMITLNISTDSRHPQEQDAYDKEQHAYRPEYVEPESWRLHLSAEFPTAVQQCDWNIEQLNGEFGHEVVQEEGVDLGQLSVAVPATGEYKIRLTVTEENGRSYSHQQTYHLRDYLIVAIGDSYFCGEGSPDEPGEPNTISGTIACNLATFTKFLVDKVDAEVPMAKQPVWQEELVHRSYKSGASLAVRELEDTEQGRVITFLNFARSGAGIENGICKPRERDEWTDLGQVAEARQTVEDRAVDVLLISTGGNEINFSDHLINLLRDDLPIVGDGGMLGADEVLNRKKELTDALRCLVELPAKLDKLAAAIQPLNPQHVFLTPYPLSHFETFDENGEAIIESGCGIFDGPEMEIDNKDALEMKKTGEQLNDTLQRAAEKHGWICVPGIVEGFAGHGRCSEDKYFYSAEESCKIQGDFKGTMHPNEKGNQVYARCIESTLREHWLEEQMVD